MAEKEQEKIRLKKGKDEEKRLKRSGKGNVKSKGCGGTAHPQCQ